MNINIDELLYQDMKWLSEQTRLNITEFLEVAYRLNLRQEDWDKFWKTVSKLRTENKDSGEMFECLISDVERSLTGEEFEVVKQILKSTPDRISNCCGAKVLGGDICSDCREHCGIIYYFEV